MHAFRLQGRLSNLARPWSTPTVISNTLGATYPLDPVAPEGADGIHPFAGPAIDWNDSPENIFKTSAIYGFMHCCKPLIPDLSLPRTNLAQ
ncbi:hypothetical protein [Pseudomonas japonica]|uniref:hypothetical protein n=1 Tax=Pseudomonas japonica TaxID=256466 RepID=UPI0015E2901F|nr:hypothetical protein [Pseudomonas japonica]MBA1244035.1 hypothetical protein [Pseudomonas japonica]